MAKVKRKLQNLSGKIGEVVYVDSPKYGSYVRVAADAAHLKMPPALKKEASRTAFLNDIGSKVNTMVDRYAGAFKSKDFYFDVQRLTRKAAMDNRYIVLKQLTGLEINPSYPLQKLGSYSCSSSYTKNVLRITIATENKPLAGRLGADCYYYAVSVMMWDEKGKVYDECQWSEWVNLKDKKPVFEFGFKRPANSVHWLLCVHLILGQDENRIEQFAAEGMQVADAGSFNKRDIDLLEKLNLAKAVKSKPEKKKEEMVRVKRKE